MAEFVRMNINVGVMYADRMKKKPNHKNIINISVLLPAVFFVILTHSTSAELYFLDQLLLRSHQSMPFSKSASTPKDVLKETISRYGKPHQEHPDMVRWFNVDGYQQVNLLRGAESNDWIGYRAMMRDGALRGSIHAPRVKGGLHPTFESVDAKCEHYDYEEFEERLKQITQSSAANLVTVPSQNTVMPVVFRFSGADIRNVAKVMTEWKSENIQVSPNLRYSVFAKSSGRVSPGDAYSAIAQQLKSRGLSFQRGLNGGIMLDWSTNECQLVSGGHADKPRPSK